MKIKVPNEVLQALSARNPYTLKWANGEVQQRYLHLIGPNREIADRLLEALQTFPPPGSEFDILEITAGLGGAGFTVTVGTGTQLRVTVTARYRQLGSAVVIKDFQIGPRIPEQVKKGLRARKRS